MATALNIGPEYVRRGMKYLQARRDLQEEIRTSLVNSGLEPNASVGAYRSELFFRQLLQVVRINIRSGRLLIELLESGRSGGFYGRYQIALVDERGFLSYPKDLDISFT